MAQAANNMEVLSNNDNIKILANVLKTNVSACTSIGTFFLPQIGLIFLDMLGLYKAVSGIISEIVARDGAISTKTPKIRQLRTVKKEILKLMETFIRKAEEMESVNANFIPPLLDAILGDYTRNTPAARDAEVLNVMATITGKLGVQLMFISQIPQTDMDANAATVDPSSAGDSRSCVRAYVEHDQSGLLGVPRTSHWVL